jgi:hypothetical protein
MLFFRGNREGDIMTPIDFKRIDYVENENARKTLKHDGSGAGPSCTSDGNGNVTGTTSVQEEITGRVQIQ